MTRVTVLDHGYVEFVDSMPRRTAICVDPIGQCAVSGGDWRVVEAARVSVAGEDVAPSSSASKLIAYLYRNQHMTPFEAVRFTFAVKLPIFVARQWVRHRAGSFNEMSGRYGRLPAEFYIPSVERILEGAQATSNKQGSGPAPFGEAKAIAIQRLMEENASRAYRDYAELVGWNVARELARCVLPVNIYTRWYWTTDLRNLLHFLGLRLHEHAQWEMRQYAEAVRDLARPVAPLTFEAAGL